MGMLHSLTGAPSMTMVFGHSVNRVGVFLKRVCEEKERAMDKPQLPIAVPTGFRIIAHRGASGYAPENTLAAFRLAQKMGVTEIEFDLQFSRDRKIMVCHDRVLDRYGYPGLRVADLTCAELSQLDMGSWFSPFLFCGENMIGFEDLLSEFRGAFTYHAEIKEPAPGLTVAILNKLGACGIERQTIITSFHFDAALEAKNMAPELPVGWLIKAEDFNIDNIRRAAAAGFYQLCPPAGAVTVKGVREAHDYIAEVRAHSVKGVPDLIRVIKTGCDGMTINWPDWLIHR
jgi:glycerophosphoryl diester phosphodiesterase